MRVMTFVLCILIASSFCFAEEYVSRYTNSKALVIGINSYLLWPHLEYAVTDAREVGAILKDKNFDVKLLLDGKATKQSIDQAIDALIVNADANSRLFLYFAGHGQTEDIPGGGERGYIVPVDADLYNWQDTMISMRDINNTIRQARAKHIFLAFDSCYSGLGLTRGLKTIKKQYSGYVDKMLRLKSIQVLTAGGRAEQAIESDGHGLFTSHLLAALSGAADMNADGYTTGTEIYAALRPSVTKLSFNRQTPQFGYIDGEGDFIFKTAAKNADPAYFTIVNMIDGIDIWVNGSEKGHGLKLGNHTINTVSGRNRILVKKGSQTFFAKKLELKPGQNYKIHITQDAHTSKARQPFAMFTITNRSIQNYSNSIAHDLDGDGYEEIITSSEKTVYAFKKNGSVLWKKVYPFDTSLDLIDDYNDEPAIAISGKAYDMVHLILLNRDGLEIWHKERRITKSYQGRPDGGGSFAELADIDNDDKKEIIAFTNAGYAGKPRGIIVYGQSGREMWRYLTGPSPTNLVVWNNGKGRPDIIIGTYSPGNGNHERHNATNDMHAYAISINGFGDTNWVMKLGTHFTGAKVLLTDLNGNGSEELYAYKWTAYDYREDEGAVYRFNKDGKIVKRFETRNSIKSVVSSKFTNRRNFLYASDKNGIVYKLSDSLKSLAKKPMNRHSRPLIINLVGVHDYDGDNKEDLLLYSFNRLQQGRNPRSDYGSKNKVFYTNMKYQILSGDLSRKIKEVSIAEEWDKWRGFKLIDLERLEMAQYPFMALSDKITVFNF